MLDVRLASAVLAAALVVLAACGDDGAEPAIDPGDGGDYAPPIDPADFTTAIDNPYLPMRPGSRWVYEGLTEDGTERTEVVVTDDVREVMGVAVVVVRDTVSLDGEVIEDTFDWFAQDRDGTVWYFGEETTEFEDGEAVSTEGSWEAGVDGALPGIVMLAEPAAGDAYRQEYYPGEAEDMGEVLRLGQSVTVRFGSFDDVVVTEDWTPLEPDVVEEKSYAPGVGLVMEEKVRGPGEERLELVEFVPGS